MITQYVAPYEVRVLTGVESGGPCTLLIQSFHCGWLAAVQAHEQLGKRFPESEGYTITVVEHFHTTEDITNSFKPTKG